MPALRRGVKLHFGNAVVDYHDPQHVERVRRVFRAANDAGMAIVAHMRSSTTYKLPYGRDEARVFLNELLPAAPDRRPRHRFCAPGLGGVPEAAVDGCGTPHDREQRGAIPARVEPVR